MLAFDSSKNSEGQGRDGKGKAMEKSSCIYLPPPPSIPRFWAFHLLGGPIPGSLRLRRAGLSSFPRKELPKQIWREEMETLFPSQTSQSLPFPSLFLSVCVCVHSKLFCVASRQQWEGLRYKRSHPLPSPLIILSLSLSLFFHAYHCCHVKLCETTILVISMFGTEVRTFTRSSTGWEMLMPWREAAPLFMAFLDKKSLIWGIICLCVWLSLSVQTWSPATNCLECWLSFPFGTVGGRLI